jgi:hypothetical protein
MRPNQAVTSGCLVASYDFYALGLVRGFARALTKGSQEKLG